MLGIIRTATVPVAVGSTLVSLVSTGFRLSCENWAASTGTFSVAMSVEHNIEDVRTKKSGLSQINMVE